MTTTAEHHSHSALSFQVLQIPQTPLPPLEQVPLPCGVFYVSVCMWKHVEMGGCKWRGPKWDPDSNLPSAEESSPRILPLPIPSISTHPQISRGHCAPESDLPWLLFSRREQGCAQEAQGKQRDPASSLLPVSPAASWQQWIHGATATTKQTLSPASLVPLTFSALLGYNGPSSNPPCGIPPGGKCHFCASACVPGQSQPIAPSPEAKNHSSGNAQLETKESLGPSQCGTGLPSAQLGHPAVTGAVQRTVVRRKEILWCQGF